MSRQKNLKRNLLICLLAGSAVMYTLPLHAATSVVANNALPQGWNSITHNHEITSGGLEMNITQSDGNGVIKWDSFNVGGSATVNFKGPETGYNTLNYVNVGGGMSQIYGTINANNNGNIFIVNPAGVQIGNSAQINVGSLYVSNKYLNENKLGDFAGAITQEMIDSTKTPDAALMSLGNINANNVTFEGNGRIVIDSERIKDEAGNDKLDYQNINITTSVDNTDNIIIGYDAYDETITNGSVVGYANKNTNDAIATVTTENRTSEYTKADGYMWVEDVEQLQAINTNLSGNYALRNSIDATSTEQQGNEFSSIGITSAGNVDNNEEGFTGKFDGLDYSIFDLNIDETGNDNVGLFGYTTDATISNVTLVAGSIRGNNNVGAVVGNANNTTVTNALNSAAVSGNSNVGGIVGSATNTTVEDAINTGAIEGRENTNGGSNVGGLIGSMNSSHLIGNSYNLGDVTSIGSNVGGLVGSASNSTIGNPSVVNGKPVENIETVYNRMDVTGAYNVGGIVGNMEGSTVQNAENSGTVEATGYTTEGYTYHTGVRNSGSLPSGTLNVDDGTVTTTVNIANAGGIAGTSSDSEIVKVTNTADVSTATKTGTQYTVDDLTYYTAGNVGGIVGRAEDTNISDATNQENEIRGAHNVGGVAGYFGGTGTVSGGINDGGDIMATGARYNDNFVRELIRPVGDSNESFIIGNIGGVVGYMDGDNVYVTESANRGTVHSQDIEEENATNVLYTSQAANVGGVVGKIDRSDTKGLDEIKNNTSLAAVNNSYNTGDVRGYTGVGGVAGMMYNGEIAASYNLGYLRTTRQSQQGGSIDALNMGGIVGDTTELSGAEVYLYDVYNKGQIGDSEFNYFGRHVGGIVGRLSGTVEKAYNNGAIYNGYNVVGGIAGWMAKGKIENAFNTGNITVLNKNDAQSQVGGIAGAASDNSDIVINNAYNLGTLRSFKDPNVANAGNNTLGGILGHIQNEKQGDASVTITNVYTTGNLFVDDGNGIGSIYGSNTIGDRLNVSNAYYISPQEGLGFTDLYGTAQNNATDSKLFVEKDQWASDAFEGGITKPGKTSGDVDEDSAWRIYGGNTPILNAFLPKAEDYFSGESGISNAMNGIDSIQYGTAYDPLLTIINAANGTNQLKYEWDKLGISNAAGLVVYGAGLTLGNVNTSGGSGYFGGTIYADGALNLNGGKNDIGLGSAADIYGSAVNITTDGKVTIYGDVTATGNTANGATSDTSDVIDVKDKGNITITAGDVDVYGTLTSAEQGSSVVVSGIEDQAVQGWKPGLDIGDEEEVMSDIADRFAHTTGTSAVDGNITINAKGTPADVDGDGKIEAGEITGGNVNLYFGNKEQGLITTGGDLTVTGTGDVYVDSDLDIGGNLTLNGTGADSEVVLDITNIGEVQEKNDNTDADNSTEYLHDFLNHFANNTNTITLGGTDDVKITVDMWDSSNAFDLDKFDLDITNTLQSKLEALNVNDGKGSDLDASDITYIWVSNADQLNGIQEYYDSVVASGGTTNILSYNFALKNDINASDLTDYNVIGTAANGDVIGYSGTFDGRGNRIIGLEVDNESNAGIFSTIGNDGTVKNLNVYSGTFTGSSTAGAIAGINNGNIENITAFGNTVTVTGNGGNAGGIAGTNSGTVDDVESSGSVIAESDNVIVGGLVGTNESGATVNNSYSNSAVTSTSGTDAGLGGVVGVNKGTVSLVDSLGVTNGTNSTKVGGVIGINSGTLSSAYNESIVNGYSNVGGIIGDNANTGTVSNIVNATSVTGENESADNVSQYVGGLVGSNSGSVTNGRNNGTITGTNYVGGMVGSNAQGATLTNLVNDSSAAIEGENYVGGIAGTNAGAITAQNQSNLINRGSITGQNYVGGVAGENIGTIEYVKNDVNLYVKDSNETAKYFGGVAGINGRVDDTSTTEDETATGTITSATNEGDVVAENAQYVGGIVGWNTVNGILDGMGNSNTGRVEGATYVGGVAGKNDADITGDVDNIVTIENSGVVIAHNGGAGGIFGENTGDIQYAEMSNSGIVSGTNYSGIDDVTNGTGGIIGVNSGDITYSSITNMVDGQVIGTSNVGGLIGYNTGTITGGRTEADDTDADDTDASYYKYQVYNNGVINAGTWDDKDNDGVIDDDEFTAATVNDNSSNIGGLIGNNADETSTGGKKGSLTAGYNTGAINAANSENVGGIAGSNSGTIDQVFNTVYNTDGTNGAITGGTNVGGLVGTNSGTLSNAYNTTEVSGNYAGNAVGNNTGNVQNIYGYGTLIGIGNNAINGYVVDTSDNNWLDSDKYVGFDFDSTGATKDGETAASDGTNDYWKIYAGSGNPLLKVFLTTLTVDSDEVDLVYNGSEQDLNIGQLIKDGIITAPVVTDADGNTIFNGLDAYKNTVLPGDNELGESELLANTDGQENVGTYDNWLYSGQIASGSTDGTFNPNNLGYDIVYTAKTGNTDDGIEIDKATINISLDDINRVYGNSTINNSNTSSIKDNNGYGYTYEIINGNLTDEMKAELSNSGIIFEQKTDGAVDNVTGNKVTEKVGDYTWSADFTLNGANENNYEFIVNGQSSNTITISDGVSKVTQADLTITVDDKTTIPGVLPGFTGTVNGLTNGDNLNYTFGLGPNGSIINIDGVYTDVIGIVVDGQFYELGNADWSQGIFANYNVKYQMGDLTVSEQLMPDIPEDWPHNRWDYLFNDAPFDRNKDFRERKAEVNFVDGGMEI